METKISQILAKLGILPNSKANTYLKALILIAVSESDKAELDYLRVAKEHGVTASFVKTVIRNAIATCWNKGSMDILNQHFGDIILNKRTKPTADELIAIIAANPRPKLLRNGAVRGEEEAKRDPEALDAMCRELAKSHGLREYWAAAVYYGEMTAEDAVKAQKENGRAFETEIRHG